VSYVTVSLARLRTEATVRRLGRAVGGCGVRDAVIVEAVRTPVGKRNGMLSGIHPADLSAHVL
jgi:hypothetical protein